MSDLNTDSTPYNIPNHTLENFRKQLHKHPELSGEERQTSKRITGFLKQYEPHQIIADIGGTGVAAIYEGAAAGPAIMLRCELDALPIQETNTFEHRSIHDNVSHKCGHDGHMAILAGIAHSLHKNPIKRGRVILYFQPAEETGTGAIQSLQDDKFKLLNPDFVFALHNIPGYPLGEVLCKSGPFSCASKGMIINLQGETSHAAHPEFGNNPAQPLAKMMQRLPSLPQSAVLKNDFSLVTLIYAKLGEIAFGTAAGEAQLMLTLRTATNDAMQTLQEKAIEIVQEEASKQDLNISFDWQDEFLATINNEAAVGYIEEATKMAGQSYRLLEEPMRWSEDFGAFTEQYKGAMFGLGSGLDCPQLHTAHYDFPDQLIQLGGTIFWNILILHQLFETV